MPENTDSAGYFEWQGHAGQYSREYRNGDLAEIDQIRPTGLAFVWRYSDSAGKLLLLGSSSTIEAAKMKCDGENRRYT
jgi:hypothetical protein